jgi:hypothetical protein
MYTVHMCTGQDISVHDWLKGGVTASDSGKECFFFSLFAQDLGPTERLNSG